MTRYEAFVEKSWRDSGIAQLLVARIRSDGQADIGFFLLDLWCLGVKDAFLCADDTEAAFQLILSERLPAEFRERIHPSCAKKLIEGALAYAEALGFAPARDYRKARRALSGLDATACPETFTFGRNGKPYYIQGPNDDSARVDRVLTVLKARCGADGFTYLLTDAGHAPDKLDTTATVFFGPKDGGGFKIPKIKLEVVGTVPGMSEAMFKELAEKAAASCPVSGLLRPGLEEFELVARLA